MYSIKEITEKKIWEDFLVSYSGFFPLFQTWQWGDVQKKIGAGVKRFGVFDGKKVVGVFQVIEIKAKRGHFLQVRHGPVIDEMKDAWYHVFDFLITFGKERKVDFIRVSPMIGNSVKLNIPLFSIAAPIHNMDAEICWVLDVTKPDEEILKNMRKSHRYLIKKAQQMPIQIIQTQKKEDLKKFLPLYKKLAKQKHFIAHSGIEEELEIFAKDNMAELFLAKYKNKIIAGALIDFVGNMAIYRHSASDEKYREVPAMYLLQWQVIKEAQKRSKKLYNFWGIASTEQKNHPWYGLSLFKKGFGGERKEFMHARDIILSPKYLKTFVIDYLTKIKKGY